jgi:hypothetical protein
MGILIATTYFISSPQFSWKLSLSLYIYMCMPSSSRISSECAPKNPKMDFFSTYLICFGSFRNSSWHGCLKNQIQMRAPMSSGCVCEREREKEREREREMCKARGGRRERGRKVPNFVCHRDRTSTAT